jgi:hypothetical protein
LKIRRVRLKRRRWRYFRGLITESLELYGKEFCIGLVFYRSCVITLFGSINSEVSNYYDGKTHDYQEHSESYVILGLDPDYVQVDSLDLSSRGRSAVFLTL